MIIPEQEELIFTAVGIVCHLYERLAILKTFSRLLCFEQVKAMKIFSEKLYASIKIKKERRSRDEK